MGFYFLLRGPHWAISEAQLVHFNQVGPGPFT